MIPKEELTGIILAGGLSERMQGKPKGLLPVKGRAMISLIYEQLRPECAKVVLNANELQYENLGISMVSDEYPGLGPAGGIYSTLKKINTPKAIIIACDIPFISSDLLQYLKANSKGHAITIPKWQGKLQPLCGIYSRSILPALDDLLKQEVLEMHSILQHFHVNVLDVDDDQPFYSPYLLENINTPKQLKKFDSLL